MSYPLMLLVATLLVLIALDLAAMRWGADSRTAELIDDDLRGAHRELP